MTRILRSTGIKIVALAPHRSRCWGFQHFHFHWWAAIHGCQSAQGKRRSGVGALDGVDRPRDSSARDDFDHVVSSFARADGAWH
jgi:hypothetical protein